MSCSICMNVFICIVHTIYTYILQNTLSLVLSTSITGYIYNLHAYINSYKYVLTALQAVNSRLEFIIKIRTVYIGSK